MTFELPTYSTKELTEMVEGITDGLNRLCQGKSDDFVAKMDVRQGGYSVHIKGTDRPGIGICHNLARVTNPALVLQLASQLRSTLAVSRPEADPIFRTEMMSRFSTAMALIQGLVESPDDVIRRGRAIAFVHDTADWLGTEVPE